MPSKNSQTQVSENTETRSAAVDLNPQQGANVIAAWQGVANLFGGQYEGFQVTPEGVILNGFSTDGAYDPATIADAVSGRDRRVSFVEAYPILVEGKAPAPFAKSIDITKWGQQFFRKPGEDGKSPEYLKTASANYKKANEFPGRKGRPKKVVRIENLGNLDPALLEGIDMSELENLQATLASVIASKGNAATTTEATA